MYLVSTGLLEFHRDILDGCSGLVFVVDEDDFLARDVDALEG